MEEYYLKNYNKFIARQTEHYLKNLLKKLARRKDYFNNRYKSDIIFKLAHNINVRSCQAFKAQSFKKLNKTFKLLQCTMSFFQRWIIH